MKATTTGNPLVRQPWQASGLQIRSTCNLTGFAQAHSVPLVPYAPHYALRTA